MSGKAPDMSSITSAAAFVETLRSSNLLEPPQLTALSQNPLTPEADARPLARQLLNQGLLTPYQVNQLLSGRGAELVLGHYVLMERLGEGGMAQVFKARHQRLDRIVALKIIRPQYVKNAEAVRRFRREVEAAAQLTHPNLVLALDA